MARSDAKERMARALVLLLEDKEFDAVSIVDIVGMSGVSRSTFYRCFDSIDDLVIYGYSRYLSDILEGPRPEFATFDEGLEYMAERVADVSWDARDELVVLHRRGLTPRMLDAGKSLVSQLDMTSEDASFALFHTSGIVGWMTVWFDEGMPGTRDDLRERLKMIALPGGYPADRSGTSS
ncbi:MAG: TetR/AcrR family transcriptional regulator [Thermoplasmata archaeon]|nr:TetR/AcrR family transcriptional regulator [Thermoplasmata archaeon]